MQIGKLSQEELGRLLSVIGRRRSEVETGAGAGEDCASLKIDGRILMSSDPITAECADAGGLAVEVNANDVYAAGGEPIACLLTVIAPCGADFEIIENVVRGAENAAKRLNIQIAGGHTEWSDAVNRIVVSAAVIGRARADIGVKNIRAGQRIVMTKYAGIEGTLILSGDKAAALRPMLGVGAESEIGVRLGVFDMHDVTEGGVLGAVAELAEGAGVGAVVFEKDVPLLELTRGLCSERGIDPLRLISSGSMLMITNDSKQLIKELAAAGINAAEIGYFAEGGCRYIDKNGVERGFTTEKDQLFKRS